MLYKFLRRKNRNSPQLRSSILLTTTCITGITECLSKDIKKRHEGVAYLLGRTDGVSTLAVLAIKPEAKTSPGSFEVDSAAMARIVRTAADMGLQVVGQVHTHPGQAFHSNGDVSGARIAYSGYISIVFPSHGRYLPSLEKSAVFFYKSGQGFLELSLSDITLIPEKI
jgi:proteasome lid subunit RPN8/RPN11